MLWIPGVSQMDRGPVVKEVNPSPRAMTKTPMLLSGLLSRSVSLCWVIATNCSPGDVGACCLKMGSECSIPDASPGGILISSRSSHYPPRTAPLIERASAGAAGIQSVACTQWHKCCLWKPHHPPTPCKHHRVIKPSRFGASLEVHPLPRCYVNSGQDQTRSAVLDCQLPSRRSTEFFFSTPALAH